MKHVRGLTMLASAALLLSIAASPVLADQAKKEPLYPNATRSEPKLDLRSQREQKKLNEGLQAVAADDAAKAKELLQPIIDDSDSKYAQALALQGLASISYKAGDLKSAIGYLQQSLAKQVMPNDTYFQLQYELAQFQMADGQYQAGLDTLAKWRAEGKRETAESYGLEATANYQLQKYDAAIVAVNKAKSLTNEPKPTWDQILMASYAATGQEAKAAELAKGQVAANPNDPTALNNAAAVLVQAQQYPEAIKLLEQAHAAGSFTTESNYITLGKLYLITGQQSDDPAPNAIKAHKLLEEGLAKGVVKADGDNYLLLGQAAEMAGQYDQALDAYGKAVPLASNGEAAVRGGRLLLNKNQYSKARGMIQQGISKGVKHMGTAYMLLAEAERGLKNKPAAIDAMKKAATYPETADKAKRWLKQAGAG